MDDKVKISRILNNGLAQGSVLASLLFNAYIADLLTTQSIKFAYADDLDIATQHIDFNETERVLKNDLITLGNYFHVWRLKPNTRKTEASCFHLNNKLASVQLNITFNRDVLNHNFHPQYLGTTLDRTLFFKTHFQNTAVKLSFRNNIIKKLCGTSWGSNFAMLCPWPYNNLLCNISPGHIPIEFDLERNLWYTFNRIWTSHGRCADSLHKWGMRNSPGYDCGAEKQIIYHIAFLFPIHAYREPRIDCLTTPPTFIKWLKKLEFKP